MADQANQGQQPDWERDFVSTLNQHGYAFHFRTLRAAQAANEERRSRWIFQVSEFPVEVRGRHSRVDYVLQMAPGQPQLGAPMFYTFLVVECKRANPTYKRWCFARAPYVRRNGSKESMLVEQVVFDNNTGQTIAVMNNYWSIPRGLEFHLGLELKVQAAKGDPQPKGVTSTGAIEDAATQVTLNLNGLIEFFKATPPPTHTQTKMTFIPVVITTAQLFSTDADIAESDLESGELTAASVPMVEQRWLFYQYPTSPSLKHTIPPPRPASEVHELLDLGKSLEAMYLRSVAIVQAKHIAEFLSWFGEHLT
jgi:hypothetical protein